MRSPRTTIRRFLLAVALVAADLAYIRGPVNVNLLIAVPILQICLFNVVSFRGSIRVFWIGFEAFGWIGVIILLSGLGPLWFGFLDGRLNDGIGSIANSHPEAGRVLAMVVLCEGTLIKDTVPGLLPESLIAGMPILILSVIGGLLTRLARSREDEAPSELIPVPARAEGNEARRGSREKSQLPGLTPRSPRNQCRKGPVRRCDTGVAGPDAEKRGELVDP